MDKVSVIIPTKNEEPNIANCLDSVKNQNCKNVEIIIVDNYSRDKTVQIAKNFTKKCFIHGRERSAQRNFGAKKASGKYLLFIDADMILDKNVVGESVKNKAKAVIIPETVIISNYWSECRKLEKEFYYDSEIEVPRFFDKNYFLKIGGYDEQLIAAEDWDLLEKIKVSDEKPKRIKAKIYHNESNLNLLDIAKKKFYYGKNLPVYFKKRKVDLIYKLSPISRNYPKIFRMLLGNPHLLPGLFLIKSIEFAAGGLGFIAGNLKK